MINWVTLIIIMRPSYTHKLSIKIGHLTLIKEKRIGIKFDLHNIILIIYIWEPSETQPGQTLEL